MAKHRFDMGGMIEMADLDSDKKVVTSAEAREKETIIVPLVTESLATNTAGCDKCASNLGELKVGDMFPILCRDHYGQFSQELFKKTWAAYEG